MLFVLLLLALIRTRMEFPTSHDYLFALSTAGQTLPDPNEDKQNDYPDENFPCCYAEDFFHPHTKDVKKVFHFSFLRRTMSIWFLYNLLGLSFTSRPSGSARPSVPDSAHECRPLWSSHPCARTIPDYQQETKASKRDKILGGFI